ncbi:hypothetical protein DFJ74DRAFT_754825 [Hyaloraphidium curvatum]|nr:hypothetical protein DFJ74DRAFT_754825 [Hyaloraphidium curvatum]
MSEPPGVYSAWQLGPPPGLPGVSQPAPPGVAAPGAPAAYAQYPGAAALTPEQYAVQMAQYAQYAQMAQYAQAAAQPAPQADYGQRARSRSPRRRSRSPRGRSRDRRDDDGGRWHHDLADDGHRSHGHGHRDRDRGDRRPKPKSINEPNQHIIVQGIPTHYSEMDVQRVLEEYGCQIESVEIQTDRRTGESRGFAFAKFTTLEGAQQFIDQNYPFVWIGQLRIRVDYSNRPSHSPAAVAAAAAAAASQAQFLGRQPAGAPAHPALYNDGANDVGTVPNKLLLVRGLDPLTTEELLFRMLREQEPALKEVRMVRDRRSNMASGFAFAELPDEAAAARLLGVLSAPEGFEVDGKRVQASYAHHGSFIPVYTYTQWAASSMQDALGKTVFLQYWDENAYCSAFPPPPAPPAEAAAGKPKKKAKKAEKKGDALDDALSAFYSDVGKAAVTAEPDPMFTVSAPSKPEVAPLSEKDDGGGEQDEGGDGSLNKKPIMSLASKKASVNIQKWAAVSGVEPEEDDGPDESKPPEPIHVPTEEEVNQTQVDLAINACLLCQRQFPSLDKLKKHQAASELHKVCRRCGRARDVPLTCLQTNMEQFLAAKREEAAKQDQEAASQWKDRAAERRKAFNQPARPPKPQRHFVGGPRSAPPPPVEEPTRRGIGGDNIGNQMLKKLGWREGEGLGRDSGGIVEPIKAEAYARGAGLGAGTKVTEPTDFEKYAANTRDAWRKRFTGESE